MKCFVLCFLLFFSLPSFSQIDSDVSINDFMKEIMSSNTEGRHTQLVLWMPTQYWKVMGGSMKVDPKSIELIQSWVKDYVIIAAADGQVMEGGVVHFKPQSELKELITLVDSTGKVFTSLAENDLPEEVASLAAILKPVFNNLLGAFGEGTHLFVFKAIDSKGHRVIDAEKKGRFTVPLNGMKNTFVLPLPSLVPPKYCPVDSAKMNGTWTYCPYHGTKL